MRSRILIATFVLGASYANPSWAIDGCVLNEGDPSTGPKPAIAALLSDDVTLPNLPDLQTGKTGFSSPLPEGIGGSFGNRATFVSVNAGLSDVHAEIWSSKTADVADSPYDFGGDGTYFRGQTWSFKCPKGNTCGATTLSRVNQAWRCSRQYPNSAITIPVQFSAPSGSSANVQSEWIQQVKNKFAEDNGIDNISEVSGSVTVEPLFAMCKRLNNCATDTDHVNYYRNVDVLRMHWEGRINPNVSGESCNAERNWVCGAAAFGCLFLCGAICAYESISTSHPVCEAVVGSKHVAIDVWLEPRAEDDGNLPLRFIKKAVKVSVESGAGSAEMTSKISSTFVNTPVEGFVAQGILGGLGTELCARGLTTKCGTWPGNFWKIIGATEVLGTSSPVVNGKHARWPMRVELMKDVHSGVLSRGRTPATTLRIPGTGIGIPIPSPETLVMNFDRGVQAVNP